ncbi:aspartate--tRNA ligase [Candidatus Uhrbacteria bacterium]|nr:aspartate--tRNA ligase [Candidatus Uhrbacteria bacterium]MBD3284279.1 aspartate--tRNA ligase [Candidatus Uhrbacteria bacterium]
MTRTIAKDTVSKSGETVKLNGWVHARRDMGKVTFLDLRDRSGLIQVVLVPSCLDEASKDLVKDIRPEFVLEIEGEVKDRDEKTINDNIETGKIEVLANTVVIQNPAKTPPFEIDKDTSVVNEEVRMKYRYLDLRSERMQKNMRLRYNVNRIMREFLHEEGFTEIETPLLTKGTPEGAREYIVPSRLHPGQFYVLPQSPQQFKQLSMVAGFERYFQFARCLRDEDQRGDRQPEFTQCDLEMSFVTREDVMDLVSRLMEKVVKEATPEKKIAQVPFPILTYAEAMEKYGSDKPDLRKDKNDPNEIAFCWIVDFPMFETLEDGTLQAMHHPFCSIHPEDKEKFMKGEDIMNIRANAYDLACNGYEIWGGSIRIHERDVQNRVFELLGLDSELIQSKFGHMLEAFEYGAPPHGGIASGQDRVVMVLANEPNIREVIPYPKDGNAKDHMMDAPSELPDKALREANIQIRK